MSFAVAVVGSGPSGFYAVEAIAKALPGCAVDLMDRLPTPYGLVRSGVAPDHQNTKNVWRVYQRIAKRPEVRYLGNVELGRDLSLAELRHAYDAVVLAVGAPIDKELGIPGEHLAGVVDSSKLSGWYNGHPDHSAFVPDLSGAGVLVIGNGNVAVDVVRVLGRIPSEMTKTDLPAYASELLGRKGIRRITMLGRRGPGDASFTPVELRELGELEATVATVDPAELPESIQASDPTQQKLKDKILEILRGYAQNDPSSKSCELRIGFYGAPIEIVGRDRVEGVVIEKTRVEGGKAVLTGERTTLPCSMVVKAIGYAVRPIEGIATRPGATAYPNVDGRIEDGLWAVGWAKRGPSGVVATNRGDSIAAMEKLLAELAPKTPKGDARAKIDALLASRGVGVTSFTDWEKIEKVEHERVVDGAPRCKVTTWDELNRIARS
jgi:NADPH-dependent glutamate synthase beta subunit-like oxidoreductase